MIVLRGFEQVLTLVGSHFNPQVTVTLSTLASISDQTDVKRYDSEVKYTAADYTIRNGPHASTIELTMPAHLTFANYIRVLVSHSKLD